MLWEHPDVPATTPTILATSGGWFPDGRTFVRPGPLLDYLLELARPPARPKLCFLNTAGGDQGWWNAAMHAAFYGRDVDVSCLNLLPMPSVADPRGHLLAQDAVWVNGGSTANLLALWRLHGLDRVLRDCWERGVVLGGVSAGSLCWHVGGSTDSFGPELRAVTDALAFLPFSNGVHYDAEEQRRPLFHRLVAEGVLPDGYATDNGAGLLFRGTEMVEAVAEVAGLPPTSSGGAPTATRKSPGSSRASSPAPGGPTRVSGSARGRAGRRRQISISSG